LRVAPPESRPDPSLTVPQDVDDATQATDVPSEILLAVGQAETQLQMVTGEKEFPGQEQGFGLMGLRGENLHDAADLAGLDVDAVKTDRKANLLATAYLLASWADELGIDAGDLNAWAPVVARYSGIQDDDEAVAEYVHHQVYGALKVGIEVEGYEVAPMDLHPNWPAPAVDGERSTASGTVWTPSPNYNSRGGADVNYVIIHDCESSYSSCWSWLANSASQVSAHYVVKEDGGEIRALVDENNRAWHIAANYDCDNDHGKDCSLNGTSMNNISVGIEHAGYASQSSWNSTMISKSAALTCGITQRNTIPRDSYHIVGHGQMQPYDRTDPGPNWPWSDYIAQVQADCGDTSGGGSSGGTSTAGSFIIDSNNSANKTSSYYSEVSANWWASTNVSNYYNTGYWVAPTAAVSDAASFWFYSDKSQCFKAEAWWTAGTDRINGITYIGWDPNDNEVGRKSVNQQSSGGKWNTLGTWKYGTGWNRVLLSRWTTAAGYAVADAVRMTPTSCP